MKQIMHTTSLIGHWSTKGTEVLEISISTEEDLFLHTIKSWSVPTWHLASSNTSSDMHDLPPMKHIEWWDHEKRSVLNVQRVTIFVGNTTEENKNYSMYTLTNLLFWMDPGRRTSEISYHNL